MATIRELLSRAPAAGVSQPQTSADDTVPGLLSQIGSTGLGAVATVGNFLDLPGSSVRDLLAGENPVDQWLTPFSAENRVSGRDLLERYGMRANRETGILGWLKDPGEGLRDLAGFAAEVLTDPFGPVGGALAKVTGLTRAMQTARTAATAAQRAQVPLILQRMPKMSRPEQTLHPLVYGLGAAAKAAFDPLSPTGRDALATAFKSVKGRARAVFDKYGWGVTDPLIQDVAAMTRESFRAISDKETADIAGFFLQTERQYGLKFRTDDAVDFRVPGNEFVEGSPARVEANKRAVRNYLENPEYRDAVNAALGPTPASGKSLPFVPFDNRSTFDTGDYVTFVGSSDLRQVESSLRLPDGRWRVRLRGSADEVDPERLVAKFRAMDVLLPAEAYRFLDRVIAKNAAARAEAVDAGWNVPDLYDPYIEHMPRQKSDVTRTGEVLTGQSPQSFAKPRQGVAQALQVSGGREQLLSGFREGTPGVEKLFRDPEFEQIVREYLPPSQGGTGTLVSDPTLDSPSRVNDIGGMPVVGRKHVEDIADLLGKDPDELWAELWELAGDRRPDRFVGQPYSGPLGPMFSVSDKGLWDGVSSSYPTTAAFVPPSILPTSTEVVLNPGEMFSISASGAFPLYRAITPDSSDVVDAYLAALRKSPSYFSAKGISSVRAVDVPAGVGDVIYRRLGFDPLPARSGLAGHEDWVKSVHNNPVGQITSTVDKRFVFPMALERGLYDKVIARYLDRLHTQGVPVLPHSAMTQFVFGRTAMFNHINSPRLTGAASTPVLPSVYLDHYIPDPATGLAAPVAISHTLTPGASTTTPWNTIPSSTDPAFLSWATVNGVNLSSPDMVTLLAKIDRKVDPDAIGYYGMHKGRPYVVQPALRPRITHPAIMGHLNARMDTLTKENPLLQTDIVQDRFESLIGSKYGSAGLVDEWMAVPDNTTKGFIARNADGTPLKNQSDALLSMSRPHWGRAVTSVIDLWDKTQRTIAGGLDVQVSHFLDELRRSPSLHSAFRFDTKAMQGLGVPQVTLGLLDTVRSDINSAISAGIVPGIVDEIPFDHTIEVVSRYKGLAYELAELPLRRLTGLFGNDPLVDAADGISKLRMQTSYINGAVGALTNLFKAQAPTVYSTRTDIPGAVRLRDWLYPPEDALGQTRRQGLWPSNLVAGTFLDNLLRSILESRVFGGTMDITPADATKLFVDTKPPYKYSLDSSAMFVDAAGKPLDGGALEEARKFAHEKLLEMELPADQAEQLRTFTETPMAAQLPELGAFLQSTANLTGALKSGYLLSVSTAVRDALGSAINAYLMGGANLGVVAKYAKDGLNFARGAPIDPTTITGLRIPEIDQYLARNGMQDTATDRGRAFQALFAAHHRAPYRHASTMNADVDAQAISGSAEAVMTAVPGQGAGQVRGGAGALAEAVVGGTAATVADIGARLRRARQTPTGASRGVVGTTTGVLHEFFNPMNVSGRYVNEPAVKSWEEAAASTGNLAVAPKVLQGTETRTVRSSRSNFFAESLNAFRGTLDTTTRTAVILDYLRRQGSKANLQDAFAFADRVLTNNDPRNFSRFENQWMRTLVPFYSFLRQSMPMFLKELTFNPGGRLGMTVRATRLAQGDEEAYVPFHLQDSAAIPLGVYEDGRAKYLSSLGLMHEDAVRYAGNILQGDIQGLLQKVISSTNPAIKLAVELSTNTSLFAATPMGGRRLDELDPNIGRLLVNLGVQDQTPGGKAPPFFSPTLEAVAAASPLSRVLSTAKIVTNPEDRTTALEKVMRTLIGTKIDTITPEQTLREIRDRLNAVEIAAGARPLTLATGTKNLRERLKEIGSTEELRRLEKIDKLLKILRKQERARQQSP